MFGTEHARLERVFLQIRGMESYPLSIADNPPIDPDADPGWAERCVIWQRVLAPYSRSSPLSISAPEPQIMFDIAESLQHPQRDGQYAAEGKVTVTAVLDELTRLLGDSAPADLREQLATPINS